MRKPILILTLCIFTSLTAVTPVSAATVKNCNNPKIVKIAGNFDDVSSIINNALANKSNVQSINTAKAKCNKKAVKAVKVVKSKKNCKTKVTSKKSTKPSSNTTSKPSTNTNTKPSTPANNNGTTTNNSSYKDFQKEVIRLVNQERAKAGLKPLTENAELDKIATLKSEDMAKLNYFSHTSPTYGSPFDMLSQFGVDYTAAGENIAYGQKTPAEVMNGWMNSSGHRANILNSNYTRIGVGIAKKSNGQLVWTQTFTRP